MNKEIQKIEPKELTIQDVKQYICPDATEKEIFMFLQIAKSCNLNPFLNQIYLVKYGSQKAQILTSYNVYLQRAERTQKYAGLKTSTSGSVKTGDLRGIVKVYRKDWTEPLEHEVYYDEYVQRRKDGVVNKFWKEKPRTMIVKVAISQAFRLAFPLDFEGMPYTQDEINTIDINGETEKTKVTMPSNVEIAQKEGVLEPEINETPKVELESEESNTEQSGMISKESAMLLVKLAQMNGYTQAEVYEIIDKLGYAKVVDILQQDYDTIVKGFQMNAEAWRKKKNEIEKEAWGE